MKVVQALVLSWLASWSSVQADDVDVLLVGNSYTQFNGLQNMLRVMLAENLVDGDQAQVQRVTTGGARLVDHLANADGSNGDTALRRNLVTEPLPLDFVVVQEQSQIPGFYDISTAYTDSLDAAVALDQLVRNLGAQTVFYQTWGRRSGDSRNSFIYPNFLAMQARLDEGYRRYVAATETPLRLTRAAPVGPAFEVIHNTYLAAGIDPVTATDGHFYRLYTNDGSHPSRQGTYLAACVIYATITGHDPRDLTYVDGNLTTTERDLLRAVAAHVVLGEPSITVIESLTLSFFNDGFE